MRQGVCLWIDKKSSHEAGDGTSVWVFDGVRGCYGRWWVVYEITGGLESRQEDGNIQ